MKTSRLCLVFCAALLLAPAMVAAAEGEDGKPGVEERDAGEAELRAEVPELHDFHEVVYPLWHKAWPERDFQWMKDLLPKVRGHVEAVQKVELPGILRDKQEAWDQEVAALTATLEEYEQAAKADDDEALLAAVEKLHANFESLVRLVRPVMEELDHYHVELYQVYHRYLPDRDREGLRTAALAMGERCRELGEAEIPSWFEEKTERLKAGFFDLCLRTDALIEVLEGGGDWDHITEAVESVHTHYQKVEHLFD